VSNRDIDSSSENVLYDAAVDVDDDDGEGVLSDTSVALDDAEEGVAAWGTTQEAGDEEEAQEPNGLTEPEELAVAEVAEAEPVEIEQEEPMDEEPAVLTDDEEGTPFPVELSHEHAAGDLHIPDGFAVLEGVPEGGRRAVGVVVSRFNGDVTTRLLARALEELQAAGVRQEAITVMVVPGAFELTLAATALAKTRRFACVVALGCVIRGDTPHFDYVASEAASGLQLAALETGVPVSFGVLTLDRIEQAEPRIEKGAEAVRSALEMADLFAHLRAAAAR
jgi:6,7-dimethyl-8-ribityllumazine synthase